MINFFIFIKECLFFEMNELEILYIIKIFILYLFNHIFKNNNLLNRDSQVLQYLIGQQTLSQLLALMGTVTL